MPLSSLANGKEQQGAFSFDVTVNAINSRSVNWRNKGSCLELWVENTGMQNVQLSFDKGVSWKILVAGGVDVYRIKMVGFNYRLAGATAATVLNCLCLTANTNPKPTLAVGQVLDGKMRTK